MSDIAFTREILTQLIAFDTTSRNSNLELIAWVEDFLTRRGIASKRVANALGWAVGMASGPNAIRAPGLRGAYHHVARS